MEQDIEKLLARLVAVKSTTNTAAELEVENFLLNYLEAWPYFKAHPDYCGRFDLPGDLHRRQCIYALVKGPSTRTVIFLNHHDVVDTGVYAEAEPWACQIQEAGSKVLPLKPDKEAEDDYVSGQWIFGRGSCDMKGGIAAQLAVLAEYAVQPEAGSLLFISVPDEESFSAGMRSILPLLTRLQQQETLEYLLLVNSEPNRREQGKQVVGIGSVGKLLPVVLVQGRAVQLGSYREGLSAVSLLSELVNATEGDRNLADEAPDLQLTPEFTAPAQETPPPAWMYARDLKTGYDFTVPFQAAGYCNILTFTKTPGQVLEYFLSRCREAADRVLARAGNGLNVKVISCGELWYLASGRPQFAQFREELAQYLAGQLASASPDYPALTIKAMQKLVAFSRYSGPLMVVGFAPPYYPAVQSWRQADAALPKVKAEAAAKKQAALEKALQAVNRILPVQFEQYFLGVSDCSYGGILRSGPGSSYSDNTPLWGPEYSFDFKALYELQVPCMLLGPWGKCLHQAGERVNRPSLTRELPQALKAVLQAVWA